MIPADENDVCMLNIYGVYRNEKILFVNIELAMKVYKVSHYVSKTTLLEKIVSGWKRQMLFFECVIKVKQTGFCFVCFKVVCFPDLVFFIISVS